MKTLIRILFFLAPVVVFGQTQDLQNMTILASQYYQNKEMGKAAELYEQLYEATKADGYFSIYLDCLMSIPDYEKAEKAIRKGLRGNTPNAFWYVQWGYLKKAEGQVSESAKMYEKAFESLGNNPGDYSTLASQFISRREFEYAEKVYLQGRKNQATNSFNYELGMVYYYMRNYDQMLKEYLEWAKQKENNFEMVKNNLQSVLSMDNDQEISKQMKTYVLKCIQKDPNELIYTRLLIWLFVQDKNFPSAIRQSISLDKRTGTEDQNIFELATIAASNKSYDEAVKAYEYLIGKGKKSEYFIPAHQQCMQMYYDRFIDEGSYDPAKASQLRDKFDQTFTILGFTAENSELLSEYAHLLAFYQNQSAEAIKILQTGLTRPGVNQQQIATIKAELADIYVFSGDLWEAVLTYSQVIEQNKSNSIGDELKFKKAKLGYYMGNFKWAKAQLDVLRASTSKLIANDAMDLSLFISENMEDDSIATPLQIFGRADLQLFRNDFQGAIAALDSVSKLYPSNSLTDDVLFRKSVIFQKQGKYADAAILLETIVKDHSWEMLADDALFQLAVLYQTKLNRIEDAKTMFKKILTDYPGSIFVVDARNEYRKMQETATGKQAETIEKK